MFDPVLYNSLANFIFKPSTHCQGNLSLVRRIGELSSCLVVKNERENKKKLYFCMRESNKKNNFKKVMKPSSIFIFPQYIFNFILSFLCIIV